MGSDLRLTGLASGMDWQPIVEKLLTSSTQKKTRSPKKKMRQSLDLGLLKSQLDTLKSASAACRMKIYSSPGCQRIQAQRAFPHLPQPNIDRRIYSW